MDQVSQAIEAQSQALLQKGTAKKLSALAPALHQLRTALLEEHDPFSLASAYSCLYSGLLIQEQLGATPFLDRVALLREALKSLPAQHSQQLRLLLVSEDRLSQAEVLEQMGGISLDLLGRQELDHLLSLLPVLSQRFGSEQPWSRWLEPARARRKELMTAARQRKRPDLKGGV